MLTKPPVPYALVWAFSVITNLRMELFEALVKVFSLFPILLTILLMWLLCAVLTAAGAFSPTNGARTDTHLQLLHRADWFRFPYPREAARVFRGGKNIT